MPTVEDTFIENRSRIQPNHTNNYGTAHGGNVMKWMDEVGVMSAMRFAGETCVTAGVAKMDFRRPIPVGSIALIEAYVYEAGRTSVRVRVRASREDPLTGEAAPTTESLFVFVAIRDGEPTPVPDLTLESETDRRLHAAAIEQSERDGV